MWYVYVSLPNKYGNHYAPTVVIYASMSLSYQSVNKKLLKPTRATCKSKKTTPCLKVYVVNWSYSVCTKSSIRTLI